ncbi:bifunctional glutamate N-acetyltransferase/amino-acid acetyltransferase ArgJ [Tateyamaria omphalii]|uniref:bifunctional glutamate N-acetyltransferase/amino-acid acetyltransferase ArgJ n=1 Tax=Tateyamaria omphalii TaxID=299262 RepID=UPI001C9968E1|nr:bifunctional glutamate N-acetyltransferase/amino-acid acetyltransferase ArgJ [Tateyamaria omphalii]MBY5933355.1 bifunctional glutamate N-acetyltransferase/amino-acid acetyltransferase ArgJ [Tateyamaria omphalii]
MAGALPRSPLAPQTFPDLPQIDGVTFAVAEAGVRYSGRADVMLAICDPGTSVAGVFTKSATRAAPVLDCQEKLGGSNDAGAAILVNAGNANAFTGRNGIDAVAAIVDATASATGLPSNRVFTASTGVIGEPLPHDRITTHLSDLVARQSADAIADAASAIMTTDTYPKGSTQVVNIGGKAVTIAGIAKGSGMIAPDMATMLVYLFTDAEIAQEELQGLVSAATDRTFNCITVDSDTSTSDTLLVAATGTSGVNVSGNRDFAASLQAVMLDLAHQVVRDGEGATKFVEIEVTGCTDEVAAKTHGLSIANSPLVKTAIAGEDPNWGRVVMAIGKSGAPADRDTLSIWFGESLVAENGWVSPTYREEDAAAHMQNEHIRIRVDCGMGSGNATVWTCDLTHGYIDINADYRS